MDISWLKDRLRGAPVALPPVLDRLSELWWRRPPRVRVLAGVVAVTLLVGLSGVRVARSPWGPPVAVPVARTDLPAGTRLAPDNVAFEDRPARLVPPDVLVDPAGRLRSPVLAGTVLTARHVAADLTALLADGEVAVPVAADGMPSVTAGDVVDVLAAATDGTGRRLVQRAHVVAVDAGWVWVAVPAGASADVAAAALQGRITLAARTAPSGS